MSDLYAGQSVTLKAVAKPAGAVLPTGDLWWECTKDDIIEFGGGDTKSTSVFALAEGTETITLHHGAFSASVTLDIKELCPTAGDEVDMGAGYLWSGCNLGAAEPQQEGNARGFVAKDLASNVATVNKITTSNFAVRPVRPVSGSVGIGSIESEGSVVDVFDILGVSVLRGVTGDKLGQLEPGIYVVRTADGKSFKVKL